MLSIYYGSLSGVHGLKYSKQNTNIRFLITGQPHLFLKQEKTGPCIWHPKMQRHQSLMRI